MGVFKEDESLLSVDLTGPYFDLFVEVVREDPPYRFGENEQVYERLLELGLANWSHAVDIRFPEDVVFIDRTLAGHFGNLSRLRAVGPWRDLLLRYTEASLQHSSPC